MHFNKAEGDSFIANDSIIFKESVLVRELREETYRNVVFELI